jgi:hypothetical protein
VVDIGRNADAEPATRRSREMPRFMMLMIPKPMDEADWAPGAEDVAAMSKYNEQLTQAGVLLALDGLQPGSKGARVSFAGGKTSVTDGPFAEAKELIGGYWMIQAKSKEEAVEWASRCPGQDGDTIEVRQVYEMTDFPEDVQAAAELSQQPPAQTSAT